VTAAPSSGPQAAIIRFALRFRGVVIASACVLLAYGVFALDRAKYNVFPEFAPPQVGIQTEAAGLTPEQVEVLVTRPIENAINGVPGVQTMRSTSIQGVSVITVFFDPASDIYRNRQVVAERLAVAAQQLPQGVQAPSMTPLTSSTGLVLVAGLTSETRSLMDLRTTADWTIRPRLLAVPGVANVMVFGGDVRSIQVQVHPDQLIRHNVTLNDVLAVARRATGIRGAGFIDTQNQRIVFQTEGQSLTANDIARTVLISQGAASVALGNVADVVETPEPPIGGAAIQGRPGVILNVSEQYAASTVEVTNGVEAALQDLRPVLQAEGIALQADLFRPANFIDTATGNVRDSLLLGTVLVTVVIFLFLFDLRMAAISFTAIPLSLLAGAIVLERLGATFNTMTLGGLAIAIGVVVDDAIIDVENIVRRLRENTRLSEPRPSARVVLEACLEVRSAVVYATFAVILVVLPITALSGLAGRLFGPLGLSYLLAVLTSLLVALTVTPALSMAFLARRVPARDPPVIRWTRAAYESLLQAIARQPRTLIGAAVAFTVAGCAVLPFFHTSFIPELREGHFIIHMSAVPGTSIDESLRIGRRVSDALRKLPVVQSVAQRVGRAEKANDTWGTHYSEIEVDLKPLSGEEAEEAQADVRKALSGFLGVNFSVKTFLTERVEETLSGYTAAVAVNVFGNDLDVLDEKAQEIARVLGEVPGATDVQIQSPPGLPQLTIRLRKPDLERWGFDAVEVLDLVRAAYQGDVVGQTHQGNQVFNVITILDADNRRHVTEVGSLPLRSPGGAYVLLKQVADIFESPGRYQVLHEGARRLQTVTANVAGSDVATFVRAAQAAIAAKVQFPAGSYLQFAGTAEAQAQSQRDLTVNALVAGLGIVLLLSIITRNWRNLLLVLANLPFAMVGGVLAVFATGGVLSLGGMVGFVTLLGITLRNSILMVAHYEHLVEVEGMTWGLDAAVRGAGDRLTPILMTSIVTGLGVLPLAIGTGDAGREIEGPMALVILGGLLTSMALNLFVLPVLALRFGRLESVVDEFSSDVVAIAQSASERIRPPSREATGMDGLRAMTPVIGPHATLSEDARHAPRKEDAVQAITPPEQILLPRPSPDGIERAEVRVDGLFKNYGRIHALDNVAFSIRAGEILGLIGPNGAGKTTLFECVAGLEAADRGDVFLGPRNIRRSSKLFYVPDGITPWPDQPVRWVLEYCLGFFGGRQAIYDQVILDLALAPLMRVPIRALSKGQRKRTLLAIGLLAPQPILLIDEPFEGLDLRQSREAAATLRRHIMPDRTFFLSIHQIADAAKVCDRFVLLSGGRMVAEGTLDVLTGVARQRAGYDPHDFEEVFLALT
jgi:CzcA family heavy metal efflux pump